MSIYPTLETAMNTKDAEMMIGLLHDDYEFVRHQTGTSMNKDETAEMLKNFMSSDSMIVHAHRCVYENDDILVHHSVMDFPDGTKEATMAVYTKKGDKFIRCETGSTLLK
ncbi:MAG: nuclear transport factor 2 family protein [Cyclobacteriaceae bacterium]|jgi:hypothetical protein|nr:nuclear transport factor 2 family protein [Cyclobacteriaceae bacterium]